jgi:hypothetical protein
MPRRNRQGRQPKNAYKLKETASKFKNTQDIFVMRDTVPSQ